MSSKVTLLGIHITYYFYKKRALEVPNESIKNQNMTLQLHTQKNNKVISDVYEYMRSKIETFIIPINPNLYKMGRVGAFESKLKLLSKVIYIILMFIASN